MMDSSNAYSTAFSVINSEAQEVSTGAICKVSKVASGGDTLSAGTMLPTHDRIPHIRHLGYRPVII